MSALSIFVPRRFVRVFVSDAASVARDPMLIFAAVLSVLPASALWIAGMVVDRSVFRLPGVDLYEIAVPVALVQPAFLVGWVTGFLLLEDRDEGALIAIDVTPIGKEGLLLYRLAITMLLTAAITLPALQLLTPNLTIPAKLLVAILVSAEAAISAMILVALARNKVEGLALTKLTGLVSVVPLLAAIPSAMRLAAGIMPTYWVGELILVPDERALPLWAIALVALTLHTGAAFIALALLRRRIG
jgi:hypothetical protein